MTTEHEAYIAQMANYYDVFERRTEMLEKGIAPPLLPALPPKPERPADLESIQIRTKRFHGANVIVTYRWI